MTIETRPAIRQIPVLKDLYLEDEKLQLLVPPRLFELNNDPAKIEAVRLNEFLGRMDNEYMPRLGALVVAREFYNSEAVVQEGEKSYGTDKWWDTVLDNRRKIAISRGLITGRDKVLIMLIADNSFNRDGVCVESFAVASDLRGSGVGTSFYDNFEKLLKSLGFTYIYGVNNIHNLAFFINRGRHLVNELSLVAQSKKPLVPEKLRYFTTIKFLDCALEKEYVGVKS